MKVLLILLFAVNIFHAQKIDVTNFKFSQFSMDEKGGVDLMFFSEIDGKGNLNAYIEGFKTKPYFSCPLDEKEISELNGLLSKPLNDYIVKEKIPSYSFPSEYYYYISYKKGDKEEKLCFLGEYMSGDFINTFRMLLDKTFDNVDKYPSKKMVVDIQKMKKEIMAQVKIEKTLPAVSSDGPPPISTGPRK